MIEIKDLHKSYHMGSNSLHVLKGINFSVQEGEMVSIMGSSGSGKSTLLNILGMLDEADLGSYTLDGKHIKNLNEKVAATYRNQFLGFIFQSFNLINRLKTLKQVQKDNEITKAPNIKMDARDFGIGAQILHDLGIQKIKLMSNTKQEKRVGMVGYGLEITDYVGY